MAPKQTEPPFLLTQLVVRVIFVALGIVAAIRFRDQPVGTGSGRMADNSVKFFQ